MYHVFICPLELFVIDMLWSFTEINEIIETMFVQNSNNPSRFPCLPYFIFITAMDILLVQSNTIFDIVHWK